MSRSLEPGAGDSLCRPGDVSSLSGRVEPTGLGGEAAALLSSPPACGEQLFAVSSPLDVGSGRILSDLQLSAYFAESSTGAVTRGSLSTEKSLSELVDAGKIEHRAAEPAREVLPPGDSQSPKLTVKFQDLSDRGADMPERAADFIVKTDGTVVLVGDPERLLNSSEIEVQLERANGQTRPSPEQEAATAELVSYLSSRIKSEHPERTRDGVRIDDAQDLVADELEKECGLKRDSGFESLPPGSRRQVEDMNRFRGGGGGTIPRREADEYFPPREVPREPTESERLAAMKDVVAGFASRGQERPYEAVHHRPDRGWTFGRYGFGFDLLSDWLESLDLENMEELERKGKLPKGTTARLRKMAESLKEHKKNPSARLDPFLEKLKKNDPGDAPTASEIKENFPRELQELAAKDMVRKFAWQTLDQEQAVDVGKVALSMHLGRVPFEADLARSDSIALMDAARQAYQIAERRIAAGDSSAPIDWTDANGRTLSVAKSSVGKVMWRDFASVVEGGRLGCAASVSEVLEQAGINGIKSAGVIDFADKAMRRGYERLPVSQARPGDIVYGVEPDSTSSGSAHIGVVGEGGVVYHNRSSTGTWSEDRLTAIFNRGRFGGNLWVLRSPRA